jgi:hypothetical protein
MPNYRYLFFLEIQSRSCIQNHLDEVYQEQHISGLDIKQNIIS